MSFTFLNELPSPAQIQERYPLSEKLQELKKQRDAEISNVIKGLDNRFLVIIGPCSADNEDSVCDYVSRLTSIQENVKDKLIIIPRVYTNKPRTTGEGYKGIASQPDPEKAPDMVEGLIAMRKMHIRAIEESGLTCADEMLYPENWGYVEDLLSYVAIGARSVEDQQHRVAGLQRREVVDQQHDGQVQEEKIRTGKDQKVTFFFASFRIPPGRGALPGGSVPL